MLQTIEHHPGLLYVIATLLPLAAFVVLLLVGGLRWAVRPRHGGEEASALYRFLGGDVMGRTPAYVATAAIGLACVLCAIGFVWHAATHEQIEKDIQKLERELGELAHKGGSK